MIRKTVTNDLCSGDSISRQSTARLVPSPEGGECAPGKTRKYNYE